MTPSVALFDGAISRIDRAAALALAAEFRVAALGRIRGEISSTFDAIAKARRQPLPSTQTFPTSISSAAVG